MNLSLSECFADVYQDMKDITTLYQIGNAEATGIGLWECKLNFKQYWGQRILSILQALHSLLYLGNVFNDESDI